jgi:pyruvate/2-oxoglutarate dehydrogenase complex dihydrolipoamide acyltransferase (E2) component
MGVDLSEISDRFITVDHVRRHLAETRVKPLPKAPPTRPAPVPPGTAPIATRKRREIRTLSRGAGATMLSLIGANVGKVRRSHLSNAFFKDRIIDLVAYEASRLMIKHPLLNAAYIDDDNVRFHNEINAGVAFDDGEHGLIVYSINGADGLDLPTIQEKFTSGLERYVLGELTAAELSSATFSITDLSYTEVDYVLPLLPVNQSSIIGITSDASGGFRLFIGFDHRLTEGREAALFLEALVARVRSFGVSAAATHDLACSFCGKDVQTEVERFQGKGLLRLISSRGEDVLCCSTCFNGW